MRKLTFALVVLLSLPFCSFAQKEPSENFVDSSKFFKECDSLWKVWRKTKGTAIRKKIELSEDSSAQFEKIKESQQLHLVVVYKKKGKNENVLAFYHYLNNKIFRIMIAGKRKQRCVFLFKDDKLMHTSCNNLDLISLADNLLVNAKKFLEIYPDVFKK